MKKVNNKIEWEKWAALVLKIFPSIKEEETKHEVLGIESIILRHLKDRKLSIVDVCCGWGRHCFELAKRKYQRIIGIDISSVFINYANEKLKTYEGYCRPQFVAKDLFEIDFKEEFDVVLNLWTSFGFYEKDDKNILMLSKIHSFLKIGGIFILDVCNRERLAFKLNGLLDEELYIQGNKHWWKVNDNLVGLAQVDFDIEKNIAKFKFLLFEKDKGLNGENAISLKLYSLIEMKNILKETGFEIKSVYGDYNLSPYTFISPRLIIVAEKLKRKNYLDTTTSS